MFLSFFKNLCKIRIVLFFELRNGTEIFLIFIFNLKWINRERNFDLLFSYRVKKIVRMGLNRIFIELILN